MARLANMPQVLTPQAAQLRQSPRQERRRQLAGRLPAAAAQCWMRRAAAGRSAGTRTRTPVHAGQAAARATSGTRCGLLVMPSGTVLRQTKAGSRALVEDTAALCWWHPALTLNVRACSLLTVWLLLFFACCCVQLASPASPDAPFEAAAAAADAEEHPDSPRPVSLELIGDKEWQRLFAVLTLSDTAAGRASSGAGSGAAQDQPGAAAAADDRSVGIRSHRLSRALHVSELPTAAASAAVVQEAPSTPARREGGSSGGSARCDVTPTRRSGFLAGEWQRVHQQRLGTPPAPQPAAAAHHAIAPFGSDCDMGF